MTRDIKELSFLIEQKNAVLETISHGDDPQKDVVLVLEKELDKLLYQYYKNLKCS